MKKIAIMISFMSLLCVLFLQPQSSAAASLYSASATINGEEYRITNNQLHFVFNVDHFVSIEGIKETDKLEKITISTPEGVKTLSFDFGDSPLLMWDQELTVVNGKADYILSNILGELDQGKDGVSIQNLRQLLYPMNNKVIANVTATYGDDSSENLKLTITQDKEMELPETERVHVDGASLNTDQGKIEAKGSNNQFTVNVAGVDGDTSITGISIFSDDAEAVSAFALDSYLYSDSTDLKFVNKTATFDFSKIDFTNLPEEYIKDRQSIELTTIQELRNLIKQIDTNTFTGIVSDHEGNQTTFTIKVVIDGWKNENGKWFFFNADGSKKTGWIYDNGWYYLADSGQMKTDWIRYNGIWYLLGHDGKMQTGWIYDNGWYFLNKDGAMETGWIKDAGNWYFLNSDGLMQTGWVKASGSWYYLNSGGVMQTGWEKVSGSWYYLNSDGAMQAGWEKVSGSWYYLNSDGAMQTGWEKVSGSWYYLNTSGIMETGWVKSGGKWYFLYNSGKMAVDTTIQGYKLGKDGAWIR
jgi:glucan-binding YG repeat protein